MTPPMGMGAKLEMAEDGTIQAFPVSIWQKPGRYPLLEYAAHACHATHLPPALSFTTLEVPDHSIWQLSRKGITAELAAAATCQGQARM